MFVIAAILSSLTCTNIYASDIFSLVVCCSEMTGFPYFIQPMLFFVYCFRGDSPNLNFIILVDDST